MFFCDFLKYNGLPVYAMRERVNRYEIRFGNMLTPVSYTHLDVYKRQMLTLPVTLRMVRCSWIEKAAVDADWSLERKGVWMAAVGGVWPTACLLYTSRCV